MILIYVKTLVMLMDSHTSCQQCLNEVTKLILEQA